VEDKIDKIRQLNPTFGQRERIESWIPVGEESGERWRPGGKPEEEMWNYGERAPALDDETLAFKEIAADLLEASGNTNDMATWIRFLDKFDEKWESGPPSKTPVWKIH